MKKVILFLSLAFLLVGCVEITDDPANKNPEIELQNEGQLEQIYEETEELEDIKFTVVLKNFEENEIDLETVTISWFHGNSEIESSKNQFTHLVEIKSTLNLSVKVVVSYEKDGKTTLLEESKVINVIEKPTQIILKNNISDDHILKLKLGADNTIIYNAEIIGNLTHKNATWIIQKRDENMGIIEEEKILVNLQDDMIIENNIGKLTLEYNFDSIGIYLINLEIGKYNSNDQHVSFDYEFEISNSGELTQVSNFTNRKLQVGKVPEKLGEGTYNWYLNGQIMIENTNKLEIIHENNDIGGYLYYVEFSPNNSELPTVKTEPILVVNAIPVGSLDELLLAINEKVKAVVLTNDILNVSKTININHEMTIVGNNHTIKSTGISIILNINSNNVYFKDIIIDQSSRYNIVYNRANNGYLENVILANPGTGGGLTDLSAGLFVNQSEVTVKNLTISNGTNTGVRIDSPYNVDNVKKSILTVLGTFKHNGVFLPIGSGNSYKKDIEVKALGFVEFVLPLQSNIDGGGMAIRRWSNESERLSWTLNDPNKTLYDKGEALDVAGITIDVKGAGHEIQGDLELVYMFLEMFDQYGTIEISNLDDEIISTYYILGFKNEETQNLDYEFGEDLLLYSSSIENPNYVRPILPTEIGQYKVRISIGGELDLGFFNIYIR